MTDSIPELLERAADIHGDREWLVASDDRLTFRSAHQRVSDIGAALARRRVRPGDIVLLVAHNRAVDLLTWLGVVQRGAIVVAVNPKSTTDELAGFIAQTRPALIVHDPELDTLVPTARAGAASGSPLATLAELSDEPAGDDRHRVSIDPGDPAVLIPTSGTTGRSKLVTQTHRAYVYAAQGFPHWLDLTSEDRLMTSLPIFHVNAPAYSTLGSLQAGAGLVLLERFSASGFLDAAREHGATQFNSIGAMLELLMSQPARDDDAANPIRLCYTGPSPTEERQLEIERRFGFRITCGYALSESPYGMIWPRGERPFGTLGVPRQHPTLGHVNEARVVRVASDESDDAGPAAAAGDDVVELEDGEVGELELRNPVVMLGYHEMPDETAEVLVDGWLRTGDLVVRDPDGYYTFVGRKKEVIRRRGENLSPLEVEQALTAHHHVADAAVIAVPSELGEDDVKAFVLPAPGATPDLAEVRASLDGVLARYKIPRYLEVVDDFPRTPTGRTAKHQLPTDRTPDEIDFETEVASG